VKNYLRWGKGSEEYGEGKPSEIGKTNPHPGIAPIQVCAENIASLVTSKKSWEVRNKNVN
jgi:hypothetical protein